MNGLVLYKKTFQELTTDELYELLRVRSEVFVVEQQICYPDMDDIDYEALHVFAADEQGHVQAYLRLYSSQLAAADKIATANCPETPGLDPDAVHMGRVLSLHHGQGLGRQIVEAGIAAAGGTLHARQIVLHSQQYCIGFYEKLGFTVCSDVFVEAEIPHVVMKCDLA